MAFCVIWNEIIILDVEERALRGVFKDEVCRMEGSCLMKSSSASLLLHASYAAVSCLLRCCLMPPHISYLYEHVLTVYAGL